MARTNLFENFEPQSKKDWIEQIQKDLKGREFNDLLTTTADGIILHPAYHRLDVEVQPQPFKTTTEWDVVQELSVGDAKSVNKEALDHLNRGATSLLFYLYGDADLDTLLKDIQIEHIRTNFVVEGDALNLARNFTNLISARGLNEREIAGSVNIDCLEILARTGNWTESEEKDFERVGELHALLPSGMKSVCVNANLFANAGATLAQQMGTALAMCYEYIHRLQLQSTEPFWINFALGSDYFGEIAKLRAVRRLWSQLQRELQMEEKEVFIYAETALRNKTIRDAYNNMIRTTSESMAAVIGGANEISVKGFNHTFKEPDNFGKRIAKNQQSILQHESHLGAVSDISRGSYFIEDLTDKLAQKAWEFFKQIENEGGYVEAIKKGWLQERIEASAQAEQKEFDEKEKVLIGANKHAVADENLKKIIVYGMFFRESGKKTEVKPVRIKRVSEGFER